MAGHDAWQGSSSSERHSPRAWCCLGRDVPAKHDVCTVLCQAGRSGSWTLGCDASTSGNGTWQRPVPASVSGSWTFGGTHTAWTWNVGSMYLDSASWTGSRTLGRDAFASGNASRRLPRPASWTGSRTLGRDAFASGNASRRLPRPASWKGSWPLGRDGDAEQMACTIPGQTGWKGSNILGCNASARQVASWLPGLEARLGIP